MDLSVKKNLFFIIFLIIFATLDFFGCASSQRKIVLDEPILSQSLINDTLSLKETEKIATIVCDSVDTLHLIDSLINCAKTYCSRNEYTQAHILLKKSMHLHSNISMPFITSINDSGDPLLQITELYVSNMPKEYLDSIPENLSSIIFRYQISTAIDTLSFSPKDSMVIASIIKCEDGVPYNIPIVHNKRVHKTLYYIITKRRRSMKTILARADYYLPFMKKMFRDNNLPTDLTYLPILESGFNPKAYSYAHASGIWQFIPSTGKIFGLRNNYWIDERRDPIKSTHAAIGYLKKLYNDFGDWYLALAGYNCGERNVIRAKKKADSNNYWSLKLPKQTMHYVPQFIAYQIVAKNPQCFGYEPEQIDPFNCDTVYISDCLDLNKISEGLGISYGYLKKINPHIKHWCTPPDMNDVLIYLPSGMKDTFNLFYSALSSEDKVKWYRYRIKSGDNLINIARRFKISVGAIRSINKMRNNFIVAGRHLYIPIPVASSYPDKGVSAKKVSRMKKKEPPEALVFRKKGIKPIKYKISQGETLSEISELFNVSIQAICRWNKISNPRSIRAGFVLTLYIDQPGQTMLTPEKIIPPAKVRELSSPKSYTVKKGDNLYNISVKLNISITDLATWNNKDLENPTIYAGEKLIYHEILQTGTSS